MKHSRLPRLRARLDSVYRLQSPSGVGAWVIDEPGPPVLRWHVALPPVLGRGWAAKALSCELGRVLSRTGARVTGRCGHVIVSADHTCAVALETIQAAIENLEPPALASVARRAAGRRLSLRELTADAAFRQLRPNAADAAPLPDLPEEPGRVLATCSVGLGRADSWTLVLSNAWADEFTRTYQAHPEPSPGPMASEGLAQSPNHAVRFVGVPGHPWASVRMIAEIPPIGAAAGPYALVAALLRTRLERTVRSHSYLLDVVIDIADRCMIVVGEPAAERVPAFLRGFGKTMDSLNSGRIRAGELTRGRENALVEWSLRAYGLEGMADILSDMVLIGRTASDLDALIDNLETDIAPEDMEQVLTHFSGIVAVDAEDMAGVDWFHMSPNRNRVSPATRNKPSRGMREGL